MTNRELATILSTTKNERRGGAPHDVWVKRNRDILLMQVRNSTDVTTKPGMLDAMRHLFSIFMPMETMGSFAHGLGVFLLVVGTVLGGGLASAQFYANSTPGQMLYGMKLAVEKAQLILAPNDEYETNLHAEFADRRIDEFARLAEQGPEQQALAPGVLAAFDKEVGALAAGLDAMRNDDHGGVVETAKLMERKMAVYQSELRKAASTLDDKYHSSLVLSHDLVDGTTLKAIAVIVDSHLANQSSVSRTVVVTKFEERILQAEASLAKAPAVPEVEEKPATTKAKAAIAQAKELLKSEDYKAALSKIEEVAQLTKEAEAEEAAAKEEAAVTPEETVTPEEEVPSVEGEAATGTEAEAESETQVAE